MGLNTIFFAWNRPLAGRERISQEHFGDLVGWLEKQVANGSIASFEPVFLEPHGGDMNGFFLIRGEASKLDALCHGEEWTGHMLRAGMHLDGSGYVRGVHGDALKQRFAMWSNHIP